MSVREAIVADARITSALRFETPHERSSLGTVWQVLRLMLVTDAFAAQVLYRLRAAVPFLGPVLHRLSLGLGGVSIGAPVTIDPGVYLIHGQVVIDGITTIGGGTQIGPFVTIGVRGEDLRGPAIGRDVFVGTGAKVLGGVTVGDGARIGANAVVLDDVPAGATVVGAPARPVA